MSGLDGVWGGEYDGRREALRDLPAHDDAAIVHATLYVGDQLARIADAAEDSMKKGGALYAIGRVMANLNAARGGP
jgi:hypothetical protein